MILSALSGKGPLSPEVTSTALTALVCKPCQGGLEPSLLCALAVAQVRNILVWLKRTIAFPTLSMKESGCDCKLKKRALCCPDRSRVNNRVD